MAALGSQSIAQSYEQLLHVDRDGGGNTTTHVAIKDGDNGTTFGFTIATDALMMSSTNRLEFGDTGTYIHQSADGVLDLVSDTEIEINATTIDINGAVAMDGAMTGGTNITISGELDAATLDISGNADIDGTLEADAYTVDGTALDEFIADTVGAMVGSNTETGVAVTYEDGDNTLDFVLGAAQTTITSLLAADIKIGEDDETKIDFETANEIHFYANNTEQVYVADNIFGPQSDSDVDLGATGVRWKDAFVDSITVTGEVDAATLDISGAIDVAGTANLDVVDIDGAFTQDGGVVVFNEAGADYDFRVESNGNANMLVVDGGNNNVGIGVASPDSNSNLHIEGGGYKTLLIDTSSSGGGGVLVEQGGTQAAFFGTGGSSWLTGSATTDALIRAETNLIFATNGNNEKMRINSAGAVTAPTTPAFSATPASNQEDITANNAYHTVVFGTEIFDQGGNFASSVFTAPVGGRYQLNTSVTMTDIDTAATAIAIRIVTSNRFYQQTIDPNFSADLNFYKFQFSVLADMDASDTAQISVLQDGGDSILNITTISTFSGYLAC